MRGRAPPGAQVPGTADGPEARIVIVGKGGVGKTTITAVLSRLLARRGCSVIAVDGDEQCNLGAALGFSARSLAEVTPSPKPATTWRRRPGRAPGRGAAACCGSTLTPPTSSTDWAPSAPTASASS